MSKTKDAMKLAWKLYRDETRTCRPKSAAGRARLFAQCLKAAWAAVKESARRAALTIAELAMEELASINQAIEHLYYLPFGLNVERRRADLLNRRGQYEAILANA